jgi:hypothetical protein
VKQKGGVRWCTEEMKTGSWSRGFPRQGELLDGEVGKRSRLRGVGQEVVDVRRGERLCMVDRDGSGE